MQCQRYILLGLLFLYIFYRRYIKDAERKELFQQAISFCCQSFRKLLKEHGTDKRDERELVQLMVEIYKAHKKCIKHIFQKESLFFTLLVDTYKVYLEGKVTKLPDNHNLFDYAMKLCQHEIIARKNLVKNGGGLPQPYVLPESLLAAQIVVLKPTLPPNPIPITTMTITPVSAPVVNTVSNVPIPNVVPSKPISLVTTPVNVPTTITTTLTNMQTTAIPNAVGTHTTPYFSGAASRPRGRPPGSKNQGPSSSPNAASLFSTGRIDAASLSAIMGIYNNPALMPSMAQYSDPAAVTALLNEYIKLTSLTGMNSMLSGGLNPTQPLPHFSAAAGISPSTTFQSATAAKLPQFDIKNLISSATINKSSVSITPTPVASSSTVISMGSGQLTITPSTSVSKSAMVKDLQTKSTYSSSSKMFSDMPGISVTKVKQKSSIPPSTSVTMIPKDLPKSLTITPAPAGYTGKLAPMNPYQTHQVTVQPEKQPKPKQKRSKQQNMAFNYAAAIAAATANRQHLLTSQQHSFAAPNNALQEYQQKMAALMTSMDPTRAKHLLEQYEEMTRASQQKPKSKQPKQHQQHQQQPSTAKGRVSVKQLQTMQNPPPKLPATVARNVSSPKSFSPSHMAKPPQTPSPKLPQKFHMPDIHGKNMSPFGGHGMSTSPILTHSALPPPNTPPGHSQIR